MEVLARAGRPSSRRCLALALAATRGLTCSSSARQAHPTREPQSKRSSPSKRKDAADSDRLLAMDNTPSRHRSQYNVDPFSLRPSEEHLSFPLVTAAQLATSSSRPRKARMLARDFIHDSLYNPHYGYFSRHAVLLPDESAEAGASPEGRIGSGFDFNALGSETDFMEAVERRYMAFEESVASQLRADAGASALTDSVRLPRAKYRAGSTEMFNAAKQRSDLERQRLNMQEEGEHDREVKNMVARQVWHTPTELFKPHYAHAIARYMLSRHDGNSPLTIYELGAGSGALSADILSYLRERAPDVYANVTYNIVEISARLSSLQQKRLELNGHEGRFKMHQKSFLDWDTPAERGSFVIAMEVLDNLTHDVLRYSTATLQPFQAHVSIDGTGDMHELWTPVADKLIQRYLDLTGGSAVTASKLLRSMPGSLRSILSEHFPFYPNLTPPHYIPTGSLQLLDVLAAHFPEHRLLISDFDELPEAIEGHTAPVVQTRIKGQMVPVTTYRVLQGFFDIFFPTDFQALSHVYQQVVRPSSLADSPQVLSHREFLEQHAETEQTTLQDGSNPMLGWYANAKWFVT